MFRRGGGAARFIAMLAVVWSAWLTLAPFESVPAASGVTVNCGAALLHTSAGTAPSCQGSARVRVQQGAFAAGFAVVLLAIARVARVHGDRLTGFLRAMRGAGGVNE